MGLGELVGRLSSGIFLHFVPNVSAHTVSTSIFLIVTVDLFVLAFAEDFNIIFALTISYGLFSGNYDLPTKFNHVLFLCDKQTNKTQKIFLRKILDISTGVISLLLILIK